MSAMPEGRSGVLVAREPVIEIAGYIGASLGLAAAGVVLGESASDGIQIVFDLITAAVLLGAGWALEASVDSYQRMRSVLWFLSVFLVADLAGTLFADEGSNPKDVALLVGLVSAAYSLALWWLSRRSLQAIALVLSVYAVLVALVFPNPAQFLFGVPDVAGVAILTWIYGGALVAVGALGLMAPRKTIVALGSIFAVFGPLLLLPGGNDVMGEVLSLATAVALVLVGSLIGERVASGLGIVGLLLASAVIVGNHVEDQGPAIAVLAMGLVLLAGAIVAARAEGGPTGPAAPATWESAPPTPPPATPPPAPPWTPPPPETQGG